MTAIYHITHIRNLTGIIAAGGVNCDRAAQAFQHARIAHEHIKARRMARRVPLAPNGTLGDYVPFYFAPRSPMLYAINSGFVEGYDEGQAPVIYLISSVEAVNATGRRWLFTEGHAEIAYTDYFNDLRHLNKIDWSVMKSKFWNDTDEDPDRKRKRQAEFLVHEFFPWEAVQHVAVYTEMMKRQVKDILGDGKHARTVRIERSWYY